jgi:hypothetical protein
MGVKRKLQRLLGVVEGHEEEIAETVSKKTSVSKEQAKKGLETVQDLAGPNSTDGSGN